jgi:hypothetical protein
VTKLAAAATIVLFGLAPAAAGVSASSRHAACAAATNIEAIVDDSGSMGDTDPTRLRVAVLEQLIDRPTSALKTFGAVEFGASAAPVFHPQLVATGGAAMKTALEARIAYDNLFTNYNAAFAAARADNPAANARIFLTDGGHDIGVYRKGHRGGPPTYVVGIGIGPPGANSDANRLQQIATDTGGKYYAGVDEASVPGVVNDLDARLNCT